MSTTRRRRIRAHQRRELVAREAPRRRDAATHPAPGYRVVDARVVPAAATAVVAVLAVLVILLLV
jgi:hypothetical protein